MNKSELLAELATKFYKVGTANQQSIDEFGIQYYLVKVYDKVGDAIRDMNLAFYVEAEGQVTEAAYWSPSEPKPTVVPSGFQVDIDNYIQSKIDVGAIEGAFTDSIDIVKEIAYGRAIIDVSGTLTEKKIFIDKDANGDLRHRAV